MSPFFVLVGFGEPRRLIYTYIYMYGTPPPVTYPFSPCLKSPSCTASKLGVQYSVFLGRRLKYNKNRIHGTVEKPKIPKPKKKHKKKNKIKKTQNNQNQEKKKAKTPKPKKKYKKNNSLGLSGIPMGLLQESRKIVFFVFFWFFGFVFFVFFFLVLVFLVFWFWHFGFLVRLHGHEATTTHFSVCLC